ncbi:hypothetical protein UP09_14220 [Bradyrhizobium sp. LTSP885]|nr:hypothetical protein UP09_14220 [Bradyrhizobium sp. LTSP885]
MTIIVPFIGSLLLFNQHIVDLLTLSPDLVAHWMKLPEGTADVVARQITLSRLYYVYFGLTFLGFGSALFSLSCPQIVKDYASSTEYVQAENLITTTTRIALIVSQISISFTQWAGGEFSMMPGVIRRLGLPSDFMNLYSVAILEVFSELPEEFPSGDDPISNTDHPFYDDEGRPNSDRIALALISGRRVVQGFVRALGKVAGTDKYRNDMLALHYLALDNTKPRLRVFVSFLYASGFILLSIPTVITFAQVSWHLLN